MQFLYSSFAALIDSCERFGSIGPKIAVTSVVSFVLTAIEMDKCSIVGPTEGYYIKFFR